MTIKKTLIYINIILFFNLFSTTHLFANEEAKGIVKERMIKFKASKTLMKKINKGLQNQNFRVIEKSAEALLIWGKEMSQNIFLKVVIILLQRHHQIFGMIQKDLNKP